MSMQGSGDFSIGSRVWPGTAKLLEEMGELQQVLGKLIAVSGDAKHWSGDLREMLVEELADVQAALHFFAAQNISTGEWLDMIKRVDEKIARFSKWHLDPQKPE